MTTPEVLFHGCWGAPGHYLRDVKGRTLWDAPTGFPWTPGLMDGGLLQNGEHVDNPDGRVWWTCGGANIAESLWHAFYWWDRSGDPRGASNSGFYVKGVPWQKGVSATIAFEIACKAYPTIVSRQKHPLILQV